MEAGTNAYSYAESRPTGLIDPTGEIGLPGAIIGASLNLGGQVGSCMALEGTLSICLKCVDMIDVAISGVAGAMGLGTLQVLKGQLNLARSAAALTKAMGCVGASVAKSGQAAIVRQYAKEKAAGAAKLATPPPLPREINDECKQFKIMHAVSALF